MPEIAAKVLIVGGGPGGYVTAIRAAQLGLDVVLAEQAGRPAPDFQAVPAEFLADASRPAIAGRMVRNLHRIYSQRDDHVRALAAVDLLLVLTPNAPDELRTRGTLYEQLDCPAAAAADFRRYLQLVPKAADAAEVEKRLSRLRDAAPTLH